MKYRKGDLSVRASSQNDINGGGVMLPPMDTAASQDGPAIQFSCILDYRVSFSVLHLMSKYREEKRTYICCPLAFSGRLS